MYLTVMMDVVVFYKLSIVTGPAKTVQVGTNYTSS